MSLSIIECNAQARGAHLSADLRHAPTNVHQTLLLSRCYCFLVFFVAFSLYFFCIVEFCCFCVL